MATQNNDTFGTALTVIMNAKDKYDTGAFSLISKHADAIDGLATRVDLAGEDESVRSIILNNYRGTVEGTRNFARYNALVALKSNISASQRTEKEALHKRDNSVLTFMLRVITAYRSLERLNAAGFSVEFKAIPNTQATSCRLKGPADDESSSFSVAQVLKLADKSLSNVTSFAQLQELASSGKKGTANADKGSNTALPMGKVAETAAALDTTLAKVDHMSKDNGMTATAREHVLRMFARLDSMLSDEEKALAHRLFDADADDESGAVAATAAGGA